MGGGGGDGQQELAKSCAQAQLFGDLDGFCAEKARSCGSGGSSTKVVRIWGAPAGARGRGLRCFWARSVGRRRLLCLQLRPGAAPGRMEATRQAPGAETR